MGAHAKAVRNRLEVFLLLMNTVAAAPPPNLMAQRSVRRIHQSNDTVIDTHRHVGGEISQLIFAARCLFERCVPELFYHRRGVRRFLRLAESYVLRTGVRNKNPDETHPPLGRKTSGLGTVGL